MNNKYNVFQMDAVDFLKTLKDDSLDLVITDPAYESLEKHRKVGTTTRLKNSTKSSNEWFEIFPNERFEELFREIYRVMKKIHIFIFFVTRKQRFTLSRWLRRWGLSFGNP